MLVLRGLDTREPPETGLSIIVPSVLLLFLLDELILLPALAAGVGDVVLT